MYVVYYGNTGVTYDKRDTVQDSGAYYTSSIEQHVSINWRVYDRKPQVESFQWCIVYSMRYDVIRKY